MQLRRALSWILAPMLEHPRSLLGVNLLYFGSVVVGMLLTLFEPQLQVTLLQMVGEAFSPTGSLGPLVQAYETGQLIPAIVLTFVVNLVLGSGIFLTLPSMIIPFAGLLTGVYRALLWGVLFSPFGGFFDAALLPHVIVILVEGEAYVVAMLGVWLWWRRVFSSPGGGWQGWLEGFRLQGRVYVAVAFLLAVSAIYEVLEVVLLTPLLI